MALHDVQESWRTDILSERFTLTKAMVCQAAWCARQEYKSPQGGKENEKGYCSKQ